MEQNVILEVNNLNVSFSSRDQTVHAVRNVSFKLLQGESLAIVGESGCGKTVTVKSIMGLLPDNAMIDRENGQILYGGQDLLKLKSKEMTDIRGKEIAMIFQDPMTSLNPTMRIGKQIAEPLAIHEGMSYSDAENRVLQLLELVRIPNAKTRAKQYPFEFSGGMRQRVVIAMALINDPKILIADEPTTALDVTIQAQILELIGDLQKELDMSVILVTHDMGVVASVADRVQVMYAGHVMEKGSTNEIFYNMKHPYSYALLQSVPTVESERKSQLYSLEGRPPDLTYKQPGCPLNPRCEYAMNICKRHYAPAFRFSETQSAHCWLHHPDAHFEGFEQETADNKQEA